LKSGNINKNFKGYIASPEVESGPGILLLHPWWGLNDFFKRTCERLAGEGFVVLAPDYYAGKIATTIEEAEHIKNNLDFNNVLRTISKSVEFLNTHPSVISPQIAVIGFSLGCRFAVQVADHFPNRISAVVLFYGGGDQFNHAKATYQGHFPEHDPWGVDQEEIDMMNNQIHEAGLTSEFYTYSNTRHWFMEEDRPEYNAEVAEKAWKRMISFLNPNL